MKQRKVIISFRSFEFIKNILQENAKEKMCDLGDVVNEIVIKNLQNHLKLTKLESEIVEEKKKELEANKYKYLRSRNAEKLNFIKNIKKQFIMFAQNRKNIIKKDLIYNMRLNLEIAKANGWINEIKIIKSLLKKVKIDIDINEPLTIDMELPKKKEINDNPDIKL